MMKSGEMTERAGEGYHLVTNGTWERQAVLSDFLSMHVHAHIKIPRVGNRRTRRARRMWWLGASIPVGFGYRGLNAQAPIG